MKNIKNIAVLFLVLFIASCCRGQNKEYGNVIPPPKVERKLDSLYPHASNVSWSVRQIRENIQSVTFECGCNEGLGALIITFDTTGNILSKNIMIDKKGLPQSILDYVTSNYPSGFKYGFITKLTDGKSVTNFTVELLQVTPDGDAVSGGWRYILKFTPKGEFASLDKK